MVSGRQPFGILPDAAVIQKVLSGDLPAQPAVGFSDPLWALLVQTWLEEYESSLPVRPYIITILERLRDEAKTWSPMCKVPDLAIPMERKASRTSSASSEPGCVSLTQKPQRRLQSHLSFLMLGSTLRSLITHSGPRR